MGETNGTEPQPWAKKGRGLSQSWVVGGMKYIL